MNKELIIETLKYISSQYTISSSDLIDDFFNKYIELIKKGLDD